MSEYRKGEVEGWYHLKCLECRKDIFGYLVVGQKYAICDECHQKEERLNE